MVVISVDINETKTVGEIREWLDEVIGWEIHSLGRKVYGIGWEIEIHLFPYTYKVDTITVKLDNPTHESLFRIAWT